MIELRSPLRLAKESDASELADLVNYAGEGLPLHVWKGLATEGQDPWEVGRTRQAKQAQKGRVFVVDHGNGAVAGLTGYKIGPTPVSIDENFPQLFRPLQELENQALDSWYVNVLACYPEHRGQGLGALLLDLAEEVAQDEGLLKTSLIVASNNTGARRLYERKDYRETAMTRCLKEDWDTDTENWVLMVKQL